MPSFADEARDRIGVLRRALDDARRGSADAAATVRRVARSLAHTAEVWELEPVRVAARATAEAETPAAVSAQAPLLLALAESASPPAGPLRVLIVEDEPTSAHLLRTLVATPGRTVRVVGTAAAAEDVLEREGADLILLDLLLPDADGRDLLLRLREQPGTAHIPVVILSGLPAEQAREECLALGAQDYLEKPRLASGELEAALAAGRAGRRRAPGPAAREDGATRPPTVRPPTVNTALLVEDDSVGAALVRFRLEKDGFEVVHFEDGARALEAARGGPHALAILDGRLAGMDGFELLERLRELDHYREVPVIMLTGMGRDEDIVRGFELGADDYLVKPFSPAELMARVHRLLHG
ncbi:MAG: response regulator [Longimicrobiales bacterium]|nr:response regulator [Longimicrobiales bacterium]